MPIGKELAVFFKNCIYFQAKKSWFNGELDRSDLIEIKDCI